MIPEPIGRRQFLVAGAVIALLAACGSDGEAGTTGSTGTAGGDGPAPASDPPAETTPATGGTSPTTPASTPPATSDTGGFPRTVTDGLGETTITAKPVRIVATADRDQLDVLLAMGIRPVQYGRSGDYETTPPWIDPALVEGIDAARMADPFLPNLELIASARPDLILDAWSEPATNESLQAIAPTVQIKTAITDSWESAQRLAGEACGTETEAEAAITATKAVIAEQAVRLEAHRDLTVAIAFILGDQLSMITGTDIGGRIVTELGLTVISTPDGASGNFSLEQIPALLGEADLILSFDYGGLDAQASNALFQALPSVQAGRVVSVPPDVASACYQESSLSLRWAASKVADALLSAASA